MVDPVNNPKHYKAGNGLEVIDVIEAFGLGDSFHLGNVVKYVLRAGHKDEEIQDLRKADWYLRRKIAGLEAARGKTMDLKQFSLCYLATPYTKWDDLDAAAAEASRITAALFQQGINVFSPISLGHQLAEHGGLAPRDPSIWPRFCAPFVEACDAMIVVHMEGWLISKGIAEEIKMFADAGKPIFDMQPGTLEFTRREDRK